jgi:hypothetical protein
MYTLMCVYGTISSIGSYQVATEVFEWCPWGHCCKGLYASIYIWSPKHFRTYTYIFSRPPPKPPALPH